MSGKNCSHAEKALIKSVSSKCLLGCTSYYKLMVGVHQFHSRLYFPTWDVYHAFAFQVLELSLGAQPYLQSSSRRNVLASWNSVLIAHTHMGTWNSSNAIIQVVWIKLSSPSTLFVSISICDGNSSHESSACNPWPFHEYALMMFNSMCLLDIFFALDLKSTLFFGQAAAKRQHSHRHAA